MTIRDTALRSALATLGLPGAVATLGLAAAAATLGLATLACQPTVRVEAPKEPIVVNLNVKIEHEVRIKVEKDVDALIDGNPDLF